MGKKVILLTVCIVIVSTTCLSSCGQKVKQDDELKWWQKTIAYEIYVNSFQDSNGDGYGDINGIRQRLDYLESLGVGAIWLTPVFASPMVDNGYDVADYYEINPLYGTMDDMEKLISEASKKNIKVVMDLVYNHTSDQCKWFTESAKSRDNEYSDWYIWRDAKPDGSEPNNWRGIFGGSAWTWCEARQQYYLHTFASAQPDLNWANPKVRKALSDIANFWIDKGAGGFRMDAIPYIKKPDDFADGPADDTEGRVSIHDMTVNSDGILDYLQEFKESIEGHDIFTVGEANGITEEQFPEWIGKDGVFDMIFEFDHLNGSEVWCKGVNMSLIELKEALTDSQEASELHGWIPVFFENHDQPRSINAYFPKDANPSLSGKALATILLTSRGTPFIYQGEEIGMTNVNRESIDFYDDLNTFNQYETAIKEGFSEDEALAIVNRYSRDNARTPMQWDDSQNAGFTTGKPWLALGDNYHTVNVKAEENDAKSVLNWYKRMSEFRRKNPVLIDGNYTETYSDSDKIYAYTRKDNSGEMLVIVNFSGEEVEYDPVKAGLSDADKKEILMDNYEDGSGIVGTLRPYEAMIIR